ncbi:MAG: hypothetical protein DSY70_00290 [Desulfobulbus sp.]|nr:MAG: hypothetical protein DSY70_00290 [Desulfobulbus sp.]
MKKIFSFFLLLLLITTLSTNVLAKEISQGSLDRLMNLTGLNAQMSLSPEAIAAGFESVLKQKGAPVANDRVITTKKLLRSVFNPSLILADIKKNIQRDISEQEASELLNWYNSDAGKLITRREIDASRPGAVNEMLSQASSLFANKKLIDIVNRIDTVAKVSETVFLFSKNTLQSLVLSSTIATNPSISEQGIKNLKIKLSEQDEQLQAKTKENSLMSLAYAYQNVDEQILEKYIAFLQQESSQKLTSDVLQSLRLTYQKALIEFAHKLIDELNRSTTTTNRMPRSE